MSAESDNTRYDWDLIERLLHEVQNSADKPFVPRKYAEEHAAAKAADGESTGNLDSLKMEVIRRRCAATRAVVERGHVGANFSC